MSNTTVPISEWCKEIRVALARKEMNLQSVADEIGYSYTTITALISGRIVKDNYLDIAKKINEVLEVNVLPEKPQLPSDEWCGAVRAKLYVKKMNISELSKSIGFNPDADSWVADFIKWWITPETGYPIPERSGVIRYMVRLNDEIIWGE